MPVEHLPEVKFAIRRVLVIDDESDHIQKLKQIVRGIEHFRAAEEKVITLANPGWRRAPFLR
jgi:hypoxanthine-guanine phosphoribosyltransferase